MPESTDRYVTQAIQWAAGRLGSTDYSLKCLAFVEDAYEIPNGIVLDGYGSAGEAAGGYGAIENTGRPPRGALVFYECHGTIGEEYHNWGHVGIALGDGTIIHAWGTVRIDDYLAVEGLPPAEGWTAPRYVGWCSAETIINHKKETTSHP